VRREAALLLAASLSLPAPLAGGPGAGAGSPQAAVPSFQAAVALVRVTVVVRDKTGALVRGLKREDFSITEDDKPQAIESFDFEDLPTEGVAAAEPFPAGEPAPAPPAAKATPAASLGQPATLPGPVDSGGRRLVVLLFDTNGLEPEQLERGVASARS
jgi:VWFA-related protein